ncbi:MAG: hypothetical protein Q7T01_00830, partial [bacterium]|nr:hypothetical protein [bacterium]
MLTKQILDYLQDEGRIDAAEASRLLVAAKQGEHVERALLDRKLLTEEELLRIRGKLLGLPV